MEPSSSASFLSTFGRHNLRCFTLKHMFPSNYKLVKCVGQGGFGEVLKCIKKDTNETVAVKVPKYGHSFNNEFNLLNFFMWHNLDKCNIVKFIDSFTLKDNRPALTFEMLDMTLKDYICDLRHFSPLDLHDVRSVIQQMATALKALKNVAVIHSDIKLDNIMLVDHEERPLRVKLIDFGLAFPTCKARQGATRQTISYRAPEIILGLPFSEAIDMWSVGVVMAFLVLGYKLFPGDTEYEAMRYIVDLLGLPADSLLDDAKYSNYYFKKAPDHWRLKTPREYWKKSVYHRDYRTYKFQSLDGIETLSLENLNIVTADERKECIDLLKAMLHIDARERITPHQVLNHPFITRGTLQHSSEPGPVEPLESSSSHTTEAGNLQTPEPGTSQAPEPKTILADETKMQAETDDYMPNKITGTTSTLPPHLVQLPQTAAALLWDEERNIVGTSLFPRFNLTGFSQSDLSLLMDEIWLGRPSTSSRSDVSSASETVPPGVILVRPAPPERCLKLDEHNEEQSGACPLDCLEDISDSDTEDRDLHKCLDNVKPPVPEECDIEQGHMELSCATSEPEEEKKKKRRKKKNCFRRFFSWMRTTVFSCTGACDEED
ncbi:homeodomain-interacting protein kinase 2-like isoform X2 [Anabas testudineus]|uniref:homeodomain-interacting protein kinase 2-like isoform X2 n=1 Tax=Anabas testudineus TaxID=64144 RepID=UPI000E4634C5|nr:homeodomain-interacting protein kinase 2-like isoform X2 [Anabas testudineus]